MSDSSTVLKKMEDVRTNMVSSILKKGKYAATTLQVRKLFEEKVLVFFTGREVDLFMDKYGNRGFFTRLKFYVGCGISLIDRYKITEALCLSNDVEKIFVKAQVDGSASGLSVQEAHNALLALGVDITQDQTNSLLRFRLRFLGDYVDFDTFYAMASPSILDIHLNSPEAPTSWKDVVLATQMIMDVLSAQEERNPRRDEH